MANRFFSQRITGTNSGKPTIRIITNYETVKYSKPEERLKPLDTYCFPYEDQIITIVKLRTPQHIEYFTSEKDTFWYEALHNHLKNENPDLPDYYDITEEDKEADKQTETQEIVTIPTRNRFSILDTDKQTNEDQPSPPEFKDKTPPLYVKFPTENKTLLDKLSKRMSCINR